LQSVREIGGESNEATIEEEIDTGKNTNQPDKQDPIYQQVETMGNIETA